MAEVSFTATPQAPSGQRRGLRAVTPFLGPAFVAAVAYVDPGNFATNLAGGAQFGYTLGWVVLGANLMAMLVQTLSAKLGIATGLSLPEVCRERLPRRLVVFLWLQAELVAMATDLAEFTGAALGLHLVFGLPLWISALLAAVATFAVLALEVGGFRRLEAAITALVGLVVLAFCLEILLSRPSPSAVAAGALEPRLPGGAALLAVSIVGATVMPHVIYLHSALLRTRVTDTGDVSRRRVFRFTIIDVLCAMGLAGLINLAMLATAAAVFFTRGDTSAGNDLGRVVSGLNGYVGDHAGTVLGVALLISGSRLLLRGHPVRADRDGGLSAPPHFGLPAPRHHDGPGPGRARARLQPDPRAGPEPGLPLLWHPLRADPAGRLYRPPQRHGRPGQPPSHHHRGHHGNRRHRRPERLPAHHRLTPRLSPG